MKGFNSKNLLSLILSTTLTLCFLAGCASSGSPSGTESVAGSSSAASTASSAGIGSAEAPSDSAGTPETPTETVKLVVSTVDGATYHMPFWIAEQKGRLKEAGIEVEYLGFDGGPVQMEAYESWDIGTTGIGGVLACTLGHDGVVIASCLDDSYPHSFYAAPDSAVVLAGQGNNTAGAQVYGDAESWKASEILSGYGDPKHYCLIKTMEGFGMSIDELNILWMQPSACVPTYYSGTGDVVGVYGAATYAPETQDLVKVIDGRDIGISLMANMVANANSLADPVKYEAIKKLVAIYFEEMEWILANRDQFADYMESYYSFIGRTYSEGRAETVIETEPFYDLKYNVEVLCAPSGTGDNNMLQQNIADVLSFYETVDVYEPGSAEAFLKPEHFNFDIIKEIYETRQ